MNLTIRRLHERSGQLSIQDLVNFLNGEREQIKEELGLIGTPNLAERNYLAGHLKQMIERLTESPPHFMDSDDTQ